MRELTHSGVLLMILAAVLTGCSPASPGTTTSATGLTATSPPGAASQAPIGVTPAPVGGSGGQLDVQVGSALHEQLSGPALTCSHVDYGGGDTKWVLSYV